MIEDLQIKYPYCSEPLILRNGKYGQLWECSEYPNAVLHARLNKRSVGYTSGFRFYNLHPLMIHQIYAELHPKFMQKVKAVDKYEQMPE